MKTKKKVTKKKTKDPGNCARFCNKDKITLKRHDAALVLRYNGGIDIFFPKQKNEDEEAKGPAVGIFKLALAIKNTEISKMLDDEFEKFVKQATEETKDDQTSPVVTPDTTTTC